MSEPEIKRVVIACDAQGNIEVAVREAAGLAARWRVPLHGVFLMDENLLRLAELPLSRHVSLLAPQGSVTFEVDQLPNLLAALAAGMRRAIEAAARHEGVDWSFAELRDLPSAASSAVAEGDILMIDAGMRPISGSWRPRSPWESAASELGSMVLLRRNEGRWRHSIVAVLDERDGDHERTLATIRSLASARDRLHVLALGSTEAETRPRDALSRQFERAGLANLSVERALGFAGVRDCLVRLNPGLVAIETSALERAELQALVRDTRCDLLLIGKA